MLTFVWGTRPEAIKLGPVLNALAGLGVPTKTICTGQHQDLLAGLDVPITHNLACPSDGAFPGWLSRVIVPLMSILSANPPAAIVVQGDTMSALAGAQAALTLGIPLAHVEAGLRSHSIFCPYPEEVIRREITKIASLHLAPTHISRRNLLNAGVSDAHIEVTGNPGVTAIRLLVQSSVRRINPYIIVTMHRQEWLALGDDHIITCFRALADWSVDGLKPRMYWPLHPRVRRILENSGFGRPGRVRLADPPGHSAFAWHLETASGILTDSGGLQEEAAALGIPCAVMRTVSDRPESINAGLAKLFRPTPFSMKDALEWLLGQKRFAPSDCYGDSRSAENVAIALDAWHKRL